MPADKIFKSSHIVMSYELDSWGHVNNAVYMNYLEKARNDFMIERGLSFNDFFEWQKFPVVRRATMEFKNPAKTGDRLKIEGWITDHSVTSFTLAYNIYNRDTNALILSAETFHVFLNERNKPSRIPETFFKKFIQQS